MEQQRWPQALECFQAVIALHPKHIQSYGDIGLCYAYLGRQQEALAALDKALELDPTSRASLTPLTSTLIMLRTED